MKVNLAVCGRFHFHNYVRFLAASGILGRFYYSHRIGSSLAIGKDIGVNLWSKEYLMHGCARLFGGPVTERMLPLLHELWEAELLRHWQPADLWHLLLHGTARRVLRRAKEEGSVVLGEAVNAHPQHLTKLLEEEDARLGIRPRRWLGSGEIRRLEEIEKTDALLVASMWLKRSFVERGYREDRIFVAPYGVNLDRFFPIQTEGRKRPFRVLSVAQISPRKGHIDLLEAWKRLRLPDAELLLIGVIDERLRPALKRYGGLYRHIARVPNSELPRYYRDASVFVLPSIEDGFAVACMEALGCGTPVITTENNGAADVIVPGRNGFVVPIRSPSAIAESLERLYEDAALLESMGAEAARQARETLGWKEHALRLIEVYREMLGRAPTGAGVNGSQ